VQILENILRLPGSSTFRFKVFAQRGTEHHYSPDARSLMVKVPPCRGRFQRVVFEQLRLPLLSHREKIDLLFSPGFVSPLFGAPLKAATIHDMYYKVLPAAVEGFQRLYWRAMIPITSRVCDVLLTVSDSSRRDIERYLPAARGKVSVTPLASRFMPADHDQAPALATAGRRYMLMIANLTPNKNVRRVVHALAILRSRHLDLEFVHIGADHRGELAKAVDDYAMSDFVRSLGKVDDATLIATAKASLCVVVPSLYEGFGLPALEAQALGAPLICSNRGALPEVAKDAALLVDPLDAQSIAAAISQLAADPELRATLRRKGLENARRFSWQCTARQTLNAFAAQLERRSRVSA
jgi:glycosyltransferase involved in cell wall biosynthesis